MVSASCTVAYHVQHRSSEIRLYHNNAPDEPPALDPRWASMALRVLAADFGIALDRVAPVRVFVDCDPDSSAGSHFNRFTKSVVLREGQADLRVLFLHEVTHLLLDRLAGSPPYWLDQGLAEYMESRALLSSFRPQLGLHPPFLDRTTESVRAIASTRGFEFERFLSDEAVDHGWSWGAPLVHYLLHHRWVEWPLASRLRRLVELDQRDLDEIAYGFRAYCRTYDPIAEFVEGYRQSDGEARLTLLYGLARFPAEFHSVLVRLHAVETAPRWRQVLATWILLEESERTVGPAFERLAPSLLPGPLPALRPTCARALVRHAEAEGVGPGHTWYPLIEPLLARFGSGRRAAEEADPWAPQDAERSGPSDAATSSF